MDLFQSPLPHCQYWQSTREYIWSIASLYLWPLCRSVVRVQPQRRTASLVRVQPLGRMVRVQPLGRTASLKPFYGANVEVAGKGFKGTTNPARGALPYYQQLWYETFWDFSWIVLTWMAKFFLLHNILMHLLSHTNINRHSNKHKHLNTQTQKKSHTTATTNWWLDLQKERTTPMFFSPPLTPPPLPYGKSNLLFMQGCVGIWQILRT